MDIFNEMDPLLRVFWLVAIPASLIFLIQSILTFSGSDSGDGINADFDGDLSGNEGEMQLFSFRNLIHFMLGFSWFGISFFHIIANPAWLIGLALGCGVLFVVTFFFIIRQIIRLQEDNTLNTSQITGLTGSVYLTIPGHKAGKGKILVSIKGAYHELDAITEAETIETGRAIRILKTVNQTIIVSPL